MEKRSSLSRMEILIVASLMLFWTAACGKGKNQSGPGELVLLCGSSFVKPVEKLYREFTEKRGIRVSATVGGSEDFLPLVKVGRKGDILVTHDPYLDYVSEAGALAGHIQVGFLSPVLAVQKGNPKGIQGLEDLAKPGLRVALSNPEYSTCGEMVFRLLREKGMEEGVMKNVGNRLTKGHSRLGTFLKAKSVDAVIMWNGVANWFQDDLDIVQAPYEYDEEIRVHVIGLNYSSHPQLVQEFIDFAGERGPAIFAGHGYVK